jgi:predicted ArsR family transcriptional regulator
VQEATGRLNAGARPVLKSAIRAGMSAGERLETWTAGAREQFEDLIEEARAEHQREDEQRGR